MVFMVKVLKESLYTEMLMNKMIHMGFSQKKKKNEVGRPGYT